MPKVCYFCKHFYFDYEPDYSYDTPGSGFEMECFKHIWVFNPRRDGQEDFARCLHTAGKCAYYEIDEKLMRVLDK